MRVGSRDPLAVRALAGCYGVALAAYPRAFRDRFAADLLDTFRSAARDVHRRRGLLGLGRLAIQALADLVTQSAAERLPSNSLNRPGGSSRRLDPGEDHHGLRNWIDTVVQDTGFAWRTLKRSPGLTLVIVSTLALGIGAVTTIFTAVNSIILRPLPYPNPDELVMVWEGAVDDPLQGSVSIRDVRDWQTMSDSFVSIAPYRGWRATLTEVDRPESLNGAFVGHEMLRTLGLRPMLGRDFLPADDVAGAAGTVLLGHSLWQRQFGASEDVLGQTITLNDTPWEVIGVLAADFRLPRRATVEILAAARIDIEEYSRGSRFLNAVGRLAPSTALDAANADLTRVSKLLEEEYPDSNLGTLAWAESLARAELGDTEQRLYLILGVVGLVLLIATVNVANLLVARASARRTEIAVRSALGAATGRLTRQMLTESFLLAALGGGAAIVLAQIGTQALLAVVPAGIPRLDEVGLNSAVLLFAAALTFITGAIFGTVPALHTVRGALGDALRASRGTGGRSGRGLRRGLVVVQVALALTLLIGSGLLLNSLARLVGTDPGFSADGVLASRIRLGARYTGEAVQERFFTELLDRLAAQPGVADVGAVFLSPFSGGNVSSSFSIVGAPEPEPDDEPGASMQAVSATYFSMLEIPIREGRSFEAGDTANSEPVAIISETTARRYWPGESPVGKMVRAHIAMDDQESDTERRIVGVVADSLHRRLDQAAQPFMYFPYRQFGTQSMYVLLRGRGDPMQLAPVLRTTVNEMDPDILVYRVTHMPDLISETVAEERFAAVLVGAFAFIALMLGCVGIYGVIAFSVAERTNEIGVRMALGAPSRSVRWLVLSETAVLAGLGVAIGLVASRALSSTLDGMLYEVSPTDVATFAGMSTLLLAMSFLASLVPTRRAVRIDPVRALRD